MFEQPWRRNEDVVDGIKKPAQERAVELEGSLLTYYVTVVRGDDGDFLDGLLRVQASQHGHGEANFAPAATYLFGDYTNDLLDTANLGRVEFVELW